MGNANVKEEMGNENVVVPERSGYALNERVSSADLMLSSPPRDERKSRSGDGFSSQAPANPLQRLNGPLSVNPSQKDSQKAVRHQNGDGIPTIITWSYGGNSVAVEGSWDNWSSRKLMQRSGKDHSILLVLPAGLYRYKFIVDGEVRYIPDLPNDSDVMGTACNLLDVNDYVPETLDSVAEFEAPPSPDSSYSQSFPDDEDFAKDPMAIPPQLQSTILGSENSTELTASCSKPQHVVLNHVFVDKGWSSQSVVALGLTHRFRSKYVTVVLYKPLKK